MDILKRHIPLLLLSLLLTGCFSDFEPDIDSKPVLCMNSLLSPGKKVEVSLTRTWRWDEGSSSDLDLTVRDAEVSLFVNGEFKETLLLTEMLPANPGWYPDKLIERYVCDYVPQSGDVIRLEASSPTFGDARAEVRVPYPVPIDSVVTTVIESNKIVGEQATRYEMSLDFRVWFTDPAETTNYYQLSASTRNPYSYSPDNDDWWQLFMDFDFSHEPLFSEHMSELELSGAESSGYTIFTDRQISGKSYPLFVTATHCNITFSNKHLISTDNPPSVEFTLESVSESYYRHVLSLWVANDGIAGSLGNIGLGDAVFTSSNVSTKAGVVAATAPYTFTVPVADILP